MRDHDDAPRPQCALTTTLTAPMDRHHAPTHEKFSPPRSTTASSIDSAESAASSNDSAEFAARRARANWGGFGRVFIPEAARDHEHRMRSTPERQLRQRLQADLQRQRRQPQQHTGDRTLFVAALDTGNARAFVPEGEFSRAVDAAKRFVRDNLGDWYTVFAVCCRPETILILPKDTNTETGPYGGAIGFTTTPSIATCHCRVLWVNKPGTGQGLQQVLTQFRLTPNPRNGWLEPGCELHVHGCTNTFREALIKLIGDSLVFGALRSYLGKIVNRIGEEESVEQELATPRFADYGGDGIPAGAYARSFIGGRDGQGAI